MSASQNSGWNKPPGRRNYTLNIWTTDYCNRSCEFCLALDLLNFDEEQASYLTGADVQKLIEWIKFTPAISENGHFLMGGEPGQHLDLVKIFRNFHDAGIRLGGIFTNGVMEPEKLEAIDSIIKQRERLDFRLVFNVDHPDRYTDGEWSLVEKNISLVTYDGWSTRTEKYEELLLAKRVSLAITLYEKGQDYDYIIKLANEFNIDRIRCAVSKPSRDLTNKHVKPEELREFKETVMDFVRDCAENNIGISFDCILQPCEFTTGEWTLVDQVSDRLVSNCSMPLDVLPDLEVIYCAATGGAFGSFEVGEENAIKKLQTMEQQANRLRGLTLERCRGCDFFEKNICQGACLRTKLEKTAEAGTAGRQME